MVKSEGMTALVTGASSGLGEAFARELAELGFNLVLTARRGDRLEALAKELGEHHKIQATCIPLDLGGRDAPQILHQCTEGSGLAVDILINNAGFANRGTFTEIPWEKLAREIDLDVRALAELSYRFLQSMRQRNLGYILNVASFAAYLPIPEYASYAAGKSYVRNFSEALAHELRDTGIRVCSLCPGGISTEFWEVAGHKPRPIVTATMMLPRDVARIGLKALFLGRRNVVAGWTNKLMAFFLRFLPRRWMTPAAASFTGQFEP